MLEIIALIKTLLLSDRTPPVMDKVTVTMSETGAAYNPKGDPTWQDLHIVPSAHDDNSGLQKYIYSVDGESTWNDVPSNWNITTDFKAEIVIRAVDRVGNISLNKVSFIANVVKTCKVDFNGTYDSISQSSKNVKYGSTYGTLPIPARNGYTFTGWKHSNGSIINSSSVVTTHENHPLTAQWNINSYTVTYNYSMNGGSSATSSNMHHMLIMLL